ncbi:MAG: serine protease Do, partial [Verrucomicrobiales bacterium]
LAAIGCSSLQAQDSTIRLLKEREKMVKAVVRNNVGATIAIEGVRAPASGSGVIVNKDGLILTAAHVTAAAGRELIVTFPDGRTVNAISLGANSSRDAGMAKITDEGDWPYVEMGDPADLDLGEWCVAMGHPGGYDPNRTPPVRLGRVWTKSFMGMLGTDCTLVGGDSGGPLFDLDGKLIGIHSSIGGQLSENRHVPMEAYTNDWDDLLGGRLWGNQRVMTGEIDPDRPAIGVQLDRSHEDGIKVSGLSDQSPAGDAGIEVGDIIRRIGKKTVSDYDQMKVVLEQLKAGQTVKIAVERGDENLEFDVKLGRLGKLWNMEREPRKESEAAPRPSLGVNLVRDAESAEVYDVVEGSAAQKAGIKAGDVVLEINGEKIGSGAQMAANIGVRKPGDQVKLLLRRDENELELEVVLGRGQ